MNKMDVVSNNIANVNTNAFKRDSVATQSFTDALMKRLHDPSGIVNRHENAVGPITNGVAVDTVYTDFSMGIIRNTEDAFNAAISGSGFFTVRVPDGAGGFTEKYTRDGSFTLDPQRTLITKDGYTVLGTNGAITVPDGEMNIERNGNIIVDGVVIGTLLMTDFQNPESLRKFGSNLYDITAESVATPFAGEVLQGYLEDSNVNSVKEMVELIATSRVYEANQRMVTYMDSILSRAVNDVGRKS